MAQESDDKICIVGLGYVGLTLAVGMIKRGFLIHGVEIDTNKLALMEAGKPHFYEAGLGSALERAVKESRITFSQHVPEKPFQIYIITVGTPIDRSTKRPRFDMIERVSNEIAKVMDKDSLIILRSTVAVGTTRDKVIPILKQKTSEPQVAFCSERTLEGKAIEELNTLPQIIGAVDEKSLTRASQLFHRITPTIVRVSSLETAELVKLIDNIYRDTQFGLANEIAEICEQLGINGYETIRAANLGYERTKIALPGYVGGPCLEKDPYILMYSLNDERNKHRIFLEARTLNEDLQARIADRILDWVKLNTLEPGKIKVSLLGLAFKGYPETNDLRGAPSLLMIKELRARGMTALFGHDFLVSEEQIKEIGIQPVGLSDAFQNANVVIFMNNNPGYKKISLNEVLSGMARPALFMDSWNMFDLVDFPVDENFSYGSIGFNFK